MSTTKWDGLTGRARQLLPRLREAYLGGPHHLQQLCLQSRFLVHEHRIQILLWMYAIDLQDLLGVRGWQVIRQLTEEEVLKVKWTLGELGLGLGWPQAAIKEFGQRLAS